ncbi:AGZA family xanthine/uracil permease-like MFS transporter [Actinocorallia herbida]|uniref:AGZA family xanthine/uracil permease-like MFS transporter n=1 Tax=Actinocorallia herbida TaxID=58109 RepID=A0A3N1CR25_9ACTN|nr:NCS2 family permease [Actinocorallia herbida]ROO83762.1 AGZA family xanthine/uracil permease-like MFS transporter [Actinocorallia herbida]
MAAAGIDRFFQVSARGSTVPRELRGGVTTFVAMAYILLLNPIILGGASDVTGAQLSVPQLTAMTALSAAIGTLLMGLVGNAPMAVAAGLGINAVVAYQAAPHMLWSQAMGLVVLEGVIIILLAVTGVRELIMNAIPLALKYAITAGIGAFIALIGMVDAGFISGGGGTVLALGPGGGGRLTGWPVLIFAFTLVLMVALYVRRTPGAILIAIVAGTVLTMIVNAFADIKDEAWGLVVPKLPEGVLGLPDFHLFGQVDLFGGFGRAGFITALVVLFTLVLSGFFDAMGTIVGLSEEAGTVTEDGRVPGLGRILTVDGVTAALGGITSSSANTVFAESAAGIGEGARTGLANIVTGLLFTLALFFTPLASLVPAQAAAPALIVVGALMMSQVGKIDWRDPEMVIPSFVTIVSMPFTYSITNGIGLGVIAFTVARTALGRKVAWPLWVISAIFLLYFFLDPLQRLFGIG